MNFLNRTGSITSENVVKISEPQIGFKVAFDERLGILNVKVVGAKQLPSEYGPMSVKGYVVKVFQFYLYFAPNIVFNYITIYPVIPKQISYLDLFFDSVVTFRHVYNFFK